MATRRSTLFGLATLAAPALLQPSQARQPASNPGLPFPLRQPFRSWDIRLVIAARDQIGVTTGYDPAYRRLDYPGGDVDPTTGVCTDVIIRAYRAAFDLDLQAAIHTDMAAHFSAYPDRWGLTSTDRNIDHRRVPNIETWLARQGAEHTDLDWQPGDIMTGRLGSARLPHIAILSDRIPRTTARFYLIHNIGRGTEESDAWDLFTDWRRFRLPPPQT